MATDTSGYVPGTITYHQENANLHQRKKASANRRMKAGIAGVGASAGAAALTNRYAPDVARALTPAARSIGMAEHAERVARTAKTVRSVGLGGSLALAGGGAALAAEGALSRARHAHGQNASSRAAIVARKRRNANVAKGASMTMSAFGVEDRRVSKADRPSTDELRQKADTLDRHSQAARKVSHAGWAAIPIGLAAGSVMGRHSVGLAHAAGIGAKKSEDIIGHVENLSRHAAAIRSGAARTQTGSIIGGGLTGITAGSAASSLGTRRNAYNRAAGRQAARDKRVTKAFGLGDVSSVIGSVKNAVLPKVAPVMAGAKKAVKLHPVAATAVGAGTAGVIAGNSMGSNDNNAS